MSDARGEKQLLSIADLPERLQAAAVKCAHLANGSVDCGFRSEIEGLATELAEYARIMEAFLTIDS